MNINNLREGYNKFCGPAVLSIITGKSTDECADVISRVTGEYKVKGVHIYDLLKAMKKLDMEYEQKDSSGTLYATIIHHINDNGMYIISTPTHYVVIEILDKKVYFCDNHTKEPIQASSSARLGNQVITIHRVWVKEVSKPVFLETTLEVAKVNDTIHVYRRHFYENPDDNRTDSLGSISYKSDGELLFILDKIKEVISE